MSTIKGLSALLCQLAYLVGELFPMDSRSLASLKRVKSIAEYRREYPITTMCRVLEVSVSGLCWLLSISVPNTSTPDGSISFFLFRYEIGGRYSFLHHGFPSNVGRDMLNSQYRWLGTMGLQSLARRLEPSKTIPFCQRPQQPLRYVSGDSAVPVAYLCLSV